MNMKMNSNRDGEFKEGFQCIFLKVNGKFAISLHAFLK